MDSFQFSSTCRALAAAARAAGLVAPSFRSPPGVDGATRTLRRRGPTSSVLAVAIHGRPTEVVLADLVEGIVIANRLTGKDSLQARTVLWEAIADQRAAA